MSKRFGRNQRRRAREALANMTSNYEQQAGLSRHLGDRVRELRDEIADAKQMAAQLSVLFSPEVYQTAGPRSGRDRLTMQVQEALQFVELGNEPAASQALAQVPLTLLLAKIETAADGGRDHLARAMHARIRFADNELAYGITEMALRGMSRRQLVKRLSQEMAHLLADKLLKDAGAMRMTRP